MNILIFDIDESNNQIYFETKFDGSEDELIELLIENKLIKYPTTFKKVFIEENLEKYNAIIYKTAEKIQIYLH
jgi:hypothetical protein